jgi:hypothetical protein
MYLVASDLPEGTGDPGDDRIGRGRSEQALAEVAAEVRVDGEFALKHTMAFRVRVAQTMLVLGVRVFRDTTELSANPNLWGRVGSPTRWIAPAT